MLYLAVDQHAKQITVVVRNSDGEDFLRCQVSTRPEKIEEFFDLLLAMKKEFMAILESCGFNRRASLGHRRVLPQNPRIGRRAHRCQLPVLLSGCAWQEPRPGKQRRGVPFH